MQPFIERRQVQSVCVGAYLHSRSITEFLSFPIFLYFIVFLEYLAEVVGMPPPTYSIPKSSTIRQNWIGRQVCFHSPGVVAASEYPDFLRCVRSKSLANFPLWGKPYHPLIFKKIYPSIASDGF